MLDPSYLVKLVTDREGYPLPKGMPVAWPIPVQSWSKAGRNLLTKIAKDLGLPKGTFKISFNAGGDGIPGEHVLHGETLYICFGAFGPQQYGYVRSCTGRKDFRGGVNHSIPAEYTDFVELCKTIARQ